MTTEAKWSDFASRDGAKTIAAANGLLPQWVSVLLVVIIAWQLAKIVWMLVPGPSAGDPVTAPANTPVTMGQTNSSADAQAIVTAHIFGEADPDMEPATPVLEEADNLQDTRLTNLSLKGTIAATRTEMAVAIIADGRDEEKVYSIGESVTSGANLHAVYADRVVLNENGVLTNLKLPKDFPEGTAPATRRKHDDDKSCNNRHAKYPGCRCTERLAARRCHSAHALFRQRPTTGLPSVSGT